MKNQSQVENQPVKVSGAISIVRERYRQILEEGYSLKRDLEEYKNTTDLILAAQCYTDIAARQVYGALPTKLVNNKPSKWPWPAKYWKPSKNPKRNLEKAGALLAAQWDLLDQTEKTIKTENE